MKIINNGETFFKSANNKCTIHIIICISIKFYVERMKRLEVTYLKVFTDNQLKIAQ